MSAKPEDQHPIELAIEEGVATVALNRPHVRNAVNDVMRAELTATLERLANDDAVRAIVLTGKGAGFCSGGDIAFTGWRRQKQLHRGVAVLHGMGKPTIAAVNGAAAGLGCDLALACDFIIASESASFIMSFILRGLVPDGGGLYFLPRRVGLPRAKELVFSGRRVGAQEALQIGLADRVTTPERLLADAREWARQLTGGSPVALALAKSILDRSLELGEEEVLALGREAQAICYTTSEHRAAVAAFLDKK